MKDHKNLHWDSLIGTSLAVTLADAKLLSFYANERVVRVPCRVTPQSTQIPASSSPLGKVPILAPIIVHLYLFL